MYDCFTKILLADAHKLLFTLFERENKLMLFTEAGK